MTLCCPADLCLLANCAVSFTPGMRNCTVYSVRWYRKHKEFWFKQQRNEIPKELETKINIQQRFKFYSSSRNTRGLVLKPCLLYRTCISKSARTTLLSQGGISCSPWSLPLFPCCKTLQQKPLQ